MSLFMEERMPNQIGQAFLRVLRHPSASSDKVFPTTAHSLSRKRACCLLDVSTICNVPSPSGTSLISLMSGAGASASGGHTCPLGGTFH